MQSSTFGKLFAALAALVIALIITLHFLEGKTPNSSTPNLAAQKLDSSSSQNSYHFQPIPVPRPQPPDLDAAGNPKIPREKVEAWLAKHNRDAISLLAAFRALGDTNYLNEAATNFPNSPQVELAVLARDEFPEDRRKWLDLFKNSSPSNSLANYLSAQDYFKNGNSDAAVQELQAASGKSQFDAFLTESRLDEEDLYLTSGYSQLDSDKESSYGTFQEYNLGELQTFDHLAVSISDLQKQYLDSGNGNSAANLAQMGMTFANQIETGDSGKYFINQLSGIAIENQVMLQLDPNKSYDFLGGQTPGQIIAQYKEQKAAFRELSQNFQAVQPYLTDTEMLDYQERVKIYGQVPAMQWLIQQHPPPASQNGRQ
jgi:hypothetical protein